MDGEAARWLTREEAATYLRLSRRQLDRLPLPRSYAAGPRSPRYNRADLDVFMASGTVTPTSTSASTVVQPPRRRPVTQAVIATDRREWLQVMKKAYCS